MNEIKDFLFENLPVPAARELLHELYEATESSDYVKTEMTSAYNVWKPAYEMMARVYELPLGNVVETNKIFNLDDRRDLCFKAFDIYVKLALLSEDPETVAAGEAMERTKTSFPVNINAGYLTQTAQTDTFLAAALGEQLEATTKVGALKVVQDMKLYNDQIHAIVANRDVLRVERDALPTRPKAREAAIEAWRFLAKYANSIVTLNFNGNIPAALAEFIDLVNKKWERYVSIYLGPKPQKPSDSDKPADGDQATDTPPADTNPPADNQPTDTPPAGDNNGDNNQGSDNDQNGGNNGGYPPGYDPDADDDPGV